MQSLLLPQLLGGLRGCSHQRRAISPQPALPSTRLQSCGTMHFLLMLTLLHGLEAIHSMLCQLVLLCDTAFLVCAASAKVSYVTFLLLNQVLTLSSALITHFLLLAQALHCPQSMLHITAVRSCVIAYSHHRAFVLYEHILSPVEEAALASFCQVLCVSTRADTNWQSCIAREHTSKCAAAQPHGAQVTSV